MICKGLQHYLVLLSLPVFPKINIFNIIFEKTVIKKKNNNTVNNYIEIKL